jgi:hypothetical protein
MSVRPSATRAGLLAVALGIVLAGCGTVAPTQTPVATQPSATATETSRPPAEVYAEIRDAVAAIRGLQPTAAVDPVTIDEAQMRANLQAEFDAAQTPAQLRDAEDLLITLGLLPSGASLRALYLDLQGDQVAGYYSPEKDELFIVNRTGSLGPVDEATYAHEFTHQLQNQRFDLDALGIDAADQSDQALARLALVEGDASSVQSEWMAANLTAKELGALLAASLDPEALAALQRAPAYLRDTAIFPYQDGLAFVSRLTANGGYAAVDAAFADPPDSTEQILHPDKYLVREAPIKVTLPRATRDAIAPGWSEAGQDTLGELILRIWLNEGGVPSAEARIATAGWGGDRLKFYRGPNGAMSVVLHSEWDTVADADEFAAAATLALGKLSPTGQVVHEPGSKTVWVAIGEVAISVVTVAAGGA